MLLPDTLYVDPILVPAVAAPSTLSCVDVDNLWVRSAFALLAPVNRNPMAIRKRYLFIVSTKSFTSSI